jgi:hypothetical protein
MPELPDLSGALTTRPPHLLFLSHEKFVGKVCTLMDRLEALLPLSCTAGAFALPPLSLRAAADAVRAEPEPDRPRVELCGVPQLHHGFAGPRAGG